MSTILKFKMNLISIITYQIHFTRHSPNVNDNERYIGNNEGLGKTWWRTRHQYASVG